MTHSALVAWCYCIAAGWLAANAAPHPLQHAHPHDEQQHPPTHACVHDAVFSRPGVLRKETISDALKLRRRARAGTKGKAGEEWGSLRVEVVYSEEGSCQAAGDSVQRISGCGQTTAYTCSSDDVLTDSKRQYLQGTVLPAAIEFWQHTLSVRREPLPNVSAGQCCGVDVAAAVDLESAGADFVLFVTFSPTVGATAAWAGACRQNDDGRPIAAHANFGPSLFPAASPGSTRFRSARNTAMHELAHALGFASSQFSEFSDQNGRYAHPTQQTTLRGHDVTYLTTPAAQQAARDLFDCDSLPGLELEDYGGSGSRLSHLEQRIVDNELMAATLFPTTVTTQLSLSVFEDMGWYRVRFDHPLVRPALWGKGMGCDFALNKCNEWGDERFFCSATQCQTGSNRCTYDHSAKGYCTLSTYSEDLPSYYQYFSNPRSGGADAFSDFCPVYRAYSNGVCSDTQQSSQEDFADVYSADSLCFHSTVKKPSASSLRDGCGNAIESKCHRHVCERNNTVLRVIFSASGDSSSVACPPEGGLVEVGGDFEGVLDCPPVERVCGMLDYGVNQCRTDNGGCDTLTECTREGDDRVCGACPVGYLGNGVTGCDANFDELVTSTVDITRNGPVVVSQPCTPTSSSSPSPTQSAIASTSQTVVSSSLVESVVPSATPSSPTSASPSGSPPAPPQGPEPDGMGIGKDWVDALDGFAARKGEEVEVANNFTLSVCLALDSIGNSTNVTTFQTPLFLNTAQGPLDEAVPLESACVVWLVGVEWTGAGRVVVDQSLLVPGQGRGTDDVLLTAPSVEMATTAGTGSWVHLAVTVQDLSVAFFNGSLALGASHTLPDSAGSVLCAGCGGGWVVGGGNGTRLLGSVGSATVYHYALPADHMAQAAQCLSAGASNGNSDDGDKKEWWANLYSYAGFGLVGVVAVLVLMGWACRSTTKAPRSQRVMVESRRAVVKPKPAASSRSQRQRGSGSANDGVQMQARSSGRSRTGPSGGRRARRGREGSRARLEPAAQVPDIPEPSAPPMLPDSGVV